MLSEFVRKHRTEIIAMCRTRVAARMTAHATQREEYGIPVFLHHLELWLEARHDDAQASASAGLHGAELLRGGFTVAEVVHDYGDACQTITELAIERNVPISIAEFRALNLCLDTAVADAVSEYERQRERDIVNERRSTSDQLVAIVGDLDNQLDTALLAFEALRTGTVGIGGRTGDVLGRSLIGLRDRIDRSLCESRLVAGVTRCESISVLRFLEDIELSAVLGARARKLELTMSDVDPRLVVHADRKLLALIIAGVLENAFETTQPHGRVTVHAYAAGDRVLFEIEDQCGGLRPDEADHAFDAREPSGDTRDGRIGLALCAAGVKALAGDIHVCNMNQGCVITVGLPRSTVHPV